MPHNCGSGNTPSLQVKIRVHELERAQVARQNYNAAEQRKRMSHKYEVTTRRTRNKQRKNKQRKNPMTPTRIQRHKGNNTNTHTTFLGQFTNTTDRLRQGALLIALPLTLVRRTNEITPKYIMIRFLSSIPNH